MAATASAREISAISPVICVTADHCARTSDAAPAVHIHDPFRGQRVDRIEDLTHLVRRLSNADVTNREPQILDFPPARRGLGVQAVFIRLEFAHLSQIDEAVDAGVEGTAAT